VRSDKLPGTVLEYGAIGTMQVRIAERALELSDRPRRC